MELISIVDCGLCASLPPDQKVSELPLPETWGRLAAILVRGGWENRWSSDLNRYASALGLEEVRVCRACGTHYHYRQDYDSHSSEPREPETMWYLRRLTPTDARVYYLDHPGLGGVVEHLDGGWLAQRYEAIIGLLRRDLPRAPDLQIERYMVDSLYLHYVDDQDWEGLRTALIAYPDPAVGVYAASRIFMAIDPQNPGRRLASSTRYWDHVSALLAADPTREPLLVAVLAGGLSAQGQILEYFMTGWELVSVAGYALRTLRTYVPRPSLAPAIQALAMALQRAGSPRGRREAGRDFLIEYVGAAPERAREVLAALAGDTDETLAVRAHCQTCLAQADGNQAVSP